MFLTPLQGSLPSQIAVRAMLLDGAGKLKDSYSFQQSICVQMMDGNVRLARVMYDQKLMMVQLKGVKHRHLRNADREAPTHVDDV